MIHASTDMTSAIPSGVVVALKAEADTCRRIPDALIQTAGPGPERAEAAARALLAQGARSLVAWGTAGALTDSLLPGDIVVADTAFEGRGHASPVTENPFAQALAARLAPLGVRRGSTCTVSEPVSASGEKLRLHATTQALCVDMESAAVARVAAAAGVPFAAVRSIVDPLGFDLPPAALAGMDQHGNTAMLPVVRELLRSPTQLKALLTLGAYFRLALRELRSAAELLAQSPPWHLS